MKNKAIIFGIGYHKFLLREMSSSNIDVLLEMMEGVTELSIEYSDSPFKYLLIETDTDVSVTIMDRKLIGTASQKEKLLEAKDAADSEADRG